MSEARSLLRPISPGAEVPGAMPAAISDAAAFALIVDRHYPAILRFLTRQTGDPELAADLTQACFLAAYRHRHQLADPAAVAGWLFSIARNQQRMEWRQQKLRRLISLDWLTSGETAPPAALRHADPTAGVVERDRIQQVLDAMSPTLREALLLHSLSGFRGGEIAAMLNISPAAARKRIVRAEAEFRHRYGAPAADLAPPADQP